MTSGAPVPEGLEAVLDPPRAYAGARLGGRLRERPEDFQVVERLGFTPDGDGTHLWLLLEKREMNTEHAAKAVARACEVARRDVGYAGLKDRHAVAQQWFSVPATRQADERVVCGAELVPGLLCLQRTHHARKLRRGANRGNGFRILVRNPDSPHGEDGLLRLAEQARNRGVPNYFGEQRFGHGGANLGKVLAQFEGRAGRTPRHLRGLYLSAARSALFNLVLARRVEEGSWDRLLPGEAVMLDGRNSFFLADGTDPDLADRLQRFDVHPSGPLWGTGDPVAQDDAAALEADALQGAAWACRGLEKAGLEQERRALRLAVPDLCVTSEPGAGWWLSFELPRGTYATAVLRELFVIG